MLSSPSRQIRARRLVIALIPGLIAAGCQSARPKGDLGAPSATPETGAAQFTPPPLAPGLANEISQLLDITTPGSGIYEPKSGRFFFTWRVSGVSQVWTIRRSGAFPQQLTGGQDTTFLADVTPDGRWLILSRDKNGEENPGLYLQSVDGGPLKVILHQAKVRTSFQMISDDGRWVYFTANDRAPDRMSIYRYNLADQKIELVLDEPGIWSVADQRGPRLLLVKLTGSTWREIYDFDLLTKNLKPVLGQNERTEYSATYSSHEGEYLVLTNKLGNFRRLYRYRRGEFTPVTPEVAWDVESFGIDRQRRRILFQINEAGYSRAFALDAKTLKPLNLPTLPQGDQVLFGRTSFDGEWTTITVGDAQRPTVNRTYHWKTGRVTEWTLPSVPEFDLTRLPAESLESYPARDGVSVPMFVYRPRECKNKVCPVIVHFHGGPEAQSRPWFSTLANLFTTRGFVFVEPNVRGSDGYGRSWLDADNGRDRAKVVTDIEDCAKFIRQNWTKNGRAPRIGVLGWSYGGYSALMAMTHFAGAYDAGVAHVGISNIVTFLNNTAPYRRVLRVSEYGDPVKDQEALLAISPITAIEKIRGPLLITQGVNDPRVPVTEATQFQQAAAKKGLPAELILFADEGHGTQKKDNRILELGHTLRFFTQHLSTSGPGLGPDRAEASP